MDNKTRFADIARGTKFVFPGETKAYVKIDEKRAFTVLGSFSRSVKASTHVVPEKTATVSDILGSWSKL